MSALREGIDVYLFLAGIIAIAELAGTQGVYGWLATRIVRVAGTSPARAFWLIFFCGALVTALLSNDTTILLLTPAAIAVSRRAGISPLAPAYAVALVSNAASFVLPISNPANLLLYPRLPGLAGWVGAFGAASAAAIAVTGAVLFFFLRGTMTRSRPEAPTDAAPDAALRLTIATVCASCIVLALAAWFRWNVGIAASLCAVCSIAIVSVASRDALLRVLREGQWSIIPLVAVLLVVVGFADRAGAVGAVRGAIAHFSILGVPGAALATGASIAVLANAINNLPAAVLAHYAAHDNAAVLVGIDLGPNIALSGSLATILWVRIVRKSGLQVSALDFFRVGAVTTVPALVAALFFVR